MKMGNDDDDINNYLPSILNPRGVKKLFNLSLTQNSVTSCRSLSLKRGNCLASVKRANHKIFSIDKENSHCKPKLARLSAPSPILTNGCKEDGYTSKGLAHIEGEVINKNIQIPEQNGQKHYQSTGDPSKGKTIDNLSISLSAIDDLETVRLQDDRDNVESSRFSFDDLDLPKEVTASTDIFANKKIAEPSIKSFIAVSSASETNDEDLLDISNSTVVYNLEKALVSVSFGVNNCDKINVNTKNSNIKKIMFTRKDNETEVDCEVIESSCMSTASETVVNASSIEGPNSTLAVNLEIKRKKPADDVIENVLILNTNDITRLSHVIVQPPNYKLVKRQIQDRSKLKNSRKRKILESAAKNVKIAVSDVLKQKRIDTYLTKSVATKRKTQRTIGEKSTDRTKVLVFNDGQDMSKTLGVGDPVKCELVGRGGPFRTVRRDDLSPNSVRLRPKTDNESSRQFNTKGSCADARCVSSKARNDSSCSQSPRKNVESIQFCTSAKSKTFRNPSPRNVPHYKIVAGTHFAVDAFSYGEIPNVKHYFLTHFHSDHYSGLKKTFNKYLFCSKITADLCMSRLGVNPKYIHVINFDETVTVDGIEVTAVDANHCPGAVMLIFTLNNGKTLLHTGDFRASPLMESYPIFWNKNIDTIYLDTTYCNPRYDFPTQDHSLEMALYILRQKKLALEKVGKKFSSVLIVCGTYTIGKEKFFLGLARRVGCSVWACPEKDRVLQTVEGRSFSQAPAHTCQLHVVPMRDLSHEKLRSYLDRLQGAFNEVVAFKPSGWENGKNTTTENDSVTIHGIPYSEHSSFSELVRFVKFLKPKQVVPTVDISGGAKAVQKFFPCPLLCEEETLSQNRITDYFSIQNRQQVTAVT